MLVRHSDGSLEAAILLATIGSRLRAAVPGRDDVVEFNRADGRWVGAGGETVEITFDPEAEAFDRAAELACVRPEPAPEALFPYRRAETGRKAARTSVN